MSTSSITERRSFLIGTNYFYRVMVKRCFTKQPATHKTIRHSPKIRLWDKSAICVSAANCLIPPSDTTHANDSYRSK